MATIGERLRALRERQDPKVSQADLGVRLGIRDRQQAQNWVTRRETGKTKVTVDEAIRMSRALGYTAGMVIAESAEAADLVRAAESADPEDVELAARLLALFPRDRTRGADERDREWLRGVIGLAEQHAEAEAAKRAAS